ncbi:hypothetical protein SDC9_167617 [bioreactor metagenome]|uniref:Uncharacterized protein n=1 Tax=bioreactor metagenome TaxID=1076179 RepID=A0A645G345_9ZZZZ
MLQNFIFVGDPILEAFRRKGDHRDIVLFGALDRIGFRLVAEQESDRRIHFA